jgi:hypothetical protein
MARKRWDDHNARIDEMIRTGELPEPPPEWPVDRPYYTIALKHHPTGREHVFDLYPSPLGRRDQFRIVQDGRDWKMEIGLTRFLAGLRAAMFGENAERRAGRG